MQFCFFYHSVYAKVKKSIPQVQFKIVGANPSPTILKLGSHDTSVSITGYVENLAEHLSAATVAIAPMLSGSGIQNKILEAMAAGTPVVATKMAINAIEVTPNRDILLGNTATEFANCVINLLKNESLRKKISLNARKLVENDYSWKAIVRKLESIYENAIETS